MLTGGFIKIFRSLVNWEWYQDINVKTLFIHLILTVNYEPQQWQGVTIETGQRVTSIEKLSKEISLSVQQIRTALKKLQSTGEISIKTTNKFTLITVENYSKFQAKEKNNNKQITNEQQTNNKRITTMGESNKKAKEYSTEISVSKDTTKNKYDEFFEKVWKLYPCKKGKTAVSKKSKETIYKVGLEKMIMTIDNYKKELAQETWKQPMNGSTFFNGRYEDYFKIETQQEEAVSIYPDL